MSAHFQTAKQFNNYIYGDDKVTALIAQSGEERSSQLKKK